MRNTPPMISPATPMIKAPAQRIVPKRAVSNAVVILRNACPMYRIAFISFSLLIYADLRAEGAEFHSLFLPLVIRHFFYASSGRFGRFRFSCHLRRGVGKQGFLEKYYPEAWRFFQKQEA